MAHVDMSYPDEYTARRQAEADAAYEEKRVKDAVKAERARIRQMALDLAQKWEEDGCEFGAQALRELAVELEDR